MGAKQQAWRALRPGVSLEIIMGEHVGAQGQKIVDTRAVITAAGQVIKHPVGQPAELVDHFVERWDAGETHARSIVERVEIDSETGDVTGPTVSDREAGSVVVDGELAERLDAQTSRAEAAEKRVIELEQSYAEADKHAAQTIDSLREQVAELEAQLDTAISYEDLAPETLATEVAKRGLTVTRADGKSGEPLKSDNVDALREDDRS